jgi:hypothetical protein
LGLYLLFSELRFREQPLRFAQRFSCQARSLDGRCGYPSPNVSVCFALGLQGIVGAL